MIDARIRKTFHSRDDSAEFALDVHIRTAARIAVLFGPSGAGKSLTLESIAGFTTPDDGRILVDDVLFFDAASRLSLSPQQRRGGYVFQSSALFPHMTLRENLGFAAGSIPRLERRRAVGAMLEQFHLGDVAGRKPGELSGGQRQRGSIARSLLSSPRILLLDEPSSGLDAPLREELYAMLDEVRGAVQIPILLVTHDLDEAMQLGEEMFVLHSGRVVQQGAPADILDRPATEEVAALLGRFNVFDAEILAMDPAANRSRLRCTAASGFAFELDGPYFPGHMLGAKLRLGIRADALRVTAYATHGVSMRLRKLGRRMQTVRAEFEGGIVAEIPGSGLEGGAHNGEWMVRFPSESLRLLK
ncbi:MAG TPA: ABC transporter ATP-binding protein [Paludibaculum sp.]|jgi:molybdate transport system ATP-binding protein